MSVIIGIVANPEKKGAPDGILRLTKILDRRGLAYLLYDELSSAYPELEGVGEMVDRAALRERASPRCPRGR